VDSLESPRQLFKMLRDELININKGARRAVEARKSLLEQIKNLRRIIVGANLCPHDNRKERMPNCHYCFDCLNWIEGPDGSTPL
jgi:hypothetical protein